MSILSRFDLNASHHFDAEQYIIQRARQLLEHRAFITSLERGKKSVTAMFDMNGSKFQAIYVLDEHRGKGVFMKEFNRNPHIPIITLDDCMMEQRLVDHKVPHICLRSRSSRAYKVIDEKYGTQRADRSNAYYMNHIDEGIAILRWIGASELTIDGYCLHPIFQVDRDLEDAFDLRPMGDNWRDCDPDAILLAMEYRSVANAYLSDRTIDSIRDIKLSPIRQVNEMLIADKVQNRKDFERYHEGVHPRSAELAEYFRNWMRRLEVSEERYQQYKEWLSMPDKFEQSIDSEDYGK